MTLNLSHKILKAVNASDQPLHTAEIARQFQGLSHYRVQITLIRLMNSGDQRRASGRGQGHLDMVAQGRFWKGERMSINTATMRT